MLVPRSHKPLHQPAGRNPLPGVLLGLVMLLLGASGGWWGRSLWQDAATLPPPPEKECAAVPVTAATTPEPELLLSTSPLTGEGVIEFRFYRDGHQEATRKWIARLPAAAPTTEPAGEGAKVNREPSETAVAERLEKLLEDKGPPASGTPSAAARSPTSETAPSAEKPAAAKPGAKPTPGQSARRGYTVQIGAYRERNQAEQQVSNLERWGFDGRIERAELAKGTWYRVRVGHALSHSQADSLRSRIQARLGIAGSLLRE